MRGSLGCDDSLVSQIVGRIGLCRADVLVREMRVIGENVLDGIAGSETAQDMLDRDPGAGDDRLAHHDLGVALDAVAMGGRPKPFISSSHESLLGAPSGPLSNNDVSLRQSRLPHGSRVCRNVFRPAERWQVLEIR